MTANEEVAMDEATVSLNGRCRFRARFQALFLTVSSQSYGQFRFQRRVLHA